MLLLNLQNYEENAPAENSTAVLKAKKEDNKDKQGAQEESDGKAE